eukprot:6844025-Prymnesium_polylepis.1
MDIFGFASRWERSSRSRRRGCVSSWPDVARAGAGERGRARARRGSAPWTAAMIDVALVVWTATWRWPPNQKNGRPMADDVARGGIGSLRAPC